MDKKSERVPGTLRTKRLIIRSLSAQDLIPVHQVLCRCFNEHDKIDDSLALQERESWLRWTILNYKWHANLHQPPYGERAVILQESQRLIGLIGLGSEINQFSQIPGLSHSAALAGFSNPEVSLFWAIDPDYQQQGFASEAAVRMLDYAFQELELTRVIASTDNENLASQAVMRKIGMALAKNPEAEPPWLQTVAVIYNPRVRL